MDINTIVPKNINKILIEEGIWECNEFEPIYLSALEVTYKGKDLISFQIEFSCWERLGKVNALLEKNQIELDGDGWELFIRKFIRERNPILENKIHGDSETETCVLWLDNRIDYIKTIEYIIKLINLNFE